ncbi:hypothetical protein PEBR_42206 [Penicillium brasilianum]|uniref:Mediator of RNA polymerase II transcription subunit 9 n=1 Tax=Penicillium brasilianum TaxID=104259 RepID=A0A1S9R809_PENBI|nr:hypothetical protein PEBR_42206 [Penicillium brasilianum]
MASRTPTAATPLPKSSAAPESPLKDGSDIPDTVPFPPPQTFEIIPPLHGILLRLLSPKPAQAGPSGVHGETAGAPGVSMDAQAQDQQAPSSMPGGDNNNNAATSQAIPDVPLHDSNGVTPLDVKDLPTATSSVRIRIQKARAVVEALPDVDRSVEEQQEEITELEDRISRLRSVISDFGSRAKKPHEGRLEIEAS